MKSLHKANPKNLPEAWRPPNLESEAGQAEEEKKAKALALFQNQKEAQALSSKESNERSRLHRGQAFTGWQPGGLQESLKPAQAEAWEFLDIANTPFDRTWKVKSPAKVEEPETANDFEDLKQARQQAEEIIIAAQAEADGILLTAQTEIDEQKKSGYEQGVVAARAEISETLSALKSAANEVEVWKNELLLQGESVVTGMIREIAQKMFGEGLVLDAAALQANVDRVMEYAHGLGALKVFLNPKDAARLGDAYWAEQQMAALGEQVKIVPSQSIKPGGCLIKGITGTVDGRVETQLSALLKTFDEPGE